MNFPIYIEKDLKSKVYDLSFDWFGNRLAIVKEQQKLSIYKFQDQNWILEYDKIDCGHNGEIWKVKWAHPNFGNIIATCSNDKSVIVLEEKKKNNREENTWEKIHWIKQFNDSVEDIKFAPKHIGFVLAAGSADGMVSIIEFEKKQFQLKSQFQAASKNISSLSWNKCAYEPNMLVVGSNNSKEIKENLLTLWMNKNNSWEKIYSFYLKNLLGQNDVSWGLLNGRQIQQIFSFDCQLWRKWCFCLEFQIEYGIEGN